MTRPSSRGAIATKRSRAAYAGAGLLRFARNDEWEGHMSRNSIALAFALTFSAASGAQATDLRLLSSWDKTNPAVGTVAEAFTKGVEAQTKGSVKFIISGPETVPPF